MMELKTMTNWLGLAAATLLVVVPPGSAAAQAPGSPPGPQKAPETTQSTEAPKPAGKSPAFKSSRKTIAPTIIPNFNQPDLSAKNSAYTLTAEDQKLDCKKLSGHIQIRIRQLRSTSVDKPTSGLSRTLQQAATPFVAGTTRGINPHGDNARDLGMIQAFNGQLKAKGCQAFNLDADLAPGATHTPRPIPKPTHAKSSPFGQAKPDLAKLNPVAKTGAVVSAPTPSPAAAPKSN
jgi:hypothetical protein